MYCYLTGKHGGGIQVSKGGGGGGIGKIIGRDVHGLYGGNGAHTSGCNTFLERGEGVNDMK